MEIERQGMSEELYDFFDIILLTVNKLLQAGL